MKRLVAVVPIAVAAAAVAAPAVSSASSNAVHPAKKQPLKMHYTRTHEGPCPFSSGPASAADL
jgi:hypothetical protein